MVANDPHSRRDSERYNRRRQILLAEWARGDEILDLGYAQAPNPYLRGRRVGVDLQLPEPGRRHYDEEVIADVTELPGPLEGRRFPTVICAELIEHVENPYDLLRRIHPLVAAGGQLLLTTPNPVGVPTLALELTRSRRYFYTTEHRWYLSPRWVERMLDDTGFTVREVRGVGLWPFGWPAVPPGLSYQVAYRAEPRP